VLDQAVIARKFFPTGFADSAIIQLAVFANPLVSVKGMRCPASVGREVFGAHSTSVVCNWGLRKLWTLYPQATGLQDVQHFMMKVVHCHR